MINLGCNLFSDTPNICTSGRLVARSHATWQLSPGFLSPSSGDFPINETMQRHVKAPKSHKYLNQLLALPYIIMYIIVYLYIHMYVYTHTHTDIYMHAHTHTYIYIYIYTHIYIYIHTYIYIHIYIYVYIYTHTHTHTYTYTYTYIYIYIYIHIVPYAHTGTVDGIVCFDPICFCAARWPSGSRSSVRVLFQATAGLVKCIPVPNWSLISHVQVHHTLSFFFKNVYPCAQAQATYQ